MLKNNVFPSYFSTSLWKRLKVLKLESTGFKCQICNSKKQLQAHHNTYERFGREKLEDLVILCDSCHRLFHDHFETNDNNDGFDQLDLLLAANDDIEN